MTWEEYTQVIEGKVQGGWNFHHALASSPLDFFVAISSAAGAVGNRGQAAYSAANCFLNALVQHRLARGLPASSLDLTAVSDSGYLAEDLEKAAEVARNLGSDTICEAEVLALLGAAINGKLSSTCNNHTITGMRITAGMRPFWTEDAKFKAMRIAAEEAAAKDASLNSVVSFNAALKAAKSLPEAEEVVCKGLVDRISSVLMMEPEDMDVTRSLSHYPLDSLVAIEIRNFITREFAGPRAPFQRVHPDAGQGRVCKEQDCFVFWLIVNLLQVVRVEECMFGFFSFLFGYLPCCAPRLV